MIAAINIQPQIVPKCKEDVTGMFSIVVRVSDDVARTREVRRLLAEVSTSTETKVGPVSDATQKNRYCCRRQDYKDKVVRTSAVCLISYSSTTCHSVARARVFERGGFTMR